MGLTAIVAPRAGNFSGAKVNKKVAPAKKMGEKGAVFEKFAVFIFPNPSRKSCRAYFAARSDCLSGLLLRRCAAYRPGRTRQRFRPVVA